MRFFSSSALPSAEKLRFAASCSAAETMFGFLPRRFQLSCPTMDGHSADAGHYLVLGFDKSIVLSCRLPSRAGDDADVTPPRPHPSRPEPGSSPCRLPSPPPLWRISKRRVTRWLALP